MLTGALPPLRLFEKRPLAPEFIAKMKEQTRWGDRARLSG